MTKKLHAANINIHLKNIFEEGELTPDAVIKENAYLLGSYGAAGCKPAPI